MGQYYKPIILTRTGKNVKAWMYSHDYKNGLKLMEHSWIGNEFVSTFESLIMPGGLGYKKPIVWAGDYADPEPETVKTPEDKGINLWDKAKDSKKIRPQEGQPPATFRFIVNHTKKEYVDKSKVKGQKMKWDSTDHTWTIHPLPLLTCEGNGRGGGDYHGDCQLVGAWARNVLSIEKNAPEGYKEIKFVATEK